MIQANWVEIVAQEKQETEALIPSGCREIGDCPRVCTEDVAGLTDITDGGECERTIVLAHHRASPKANGRDGEYYSGDVNVHGGRDYEFPGTDRSKSALNLQSAILQTPPR